MALNKGRVINDIVEVEAKKSVYKVSDMLVPFFTVIVFILLTVYVYMPQLGDAISYAKEISTLRDEQKKLESNLQIVRTLEENQNQLVLDNRVAKQVVPAKLAVSDFAFDINRLATDRNLNLQSISSSDINASTSDEFKFVTGVAKGITGPLRYDGEFNDVISFLDLIKVQSPYLIESSETKVSRYLDFEDRWSLDISITGFYMVDDKDITFNPLGNITIYTSMPELMDEMRARSESIKSAQK